MSRQRTLEQERADKAWQQIQAVKNFSGKVPQEYSSLAKKAPADIQANGLGQTLAFWRAKGFNGGKDSGNTADYQLLQHVTEWLNSDKSLNLGKTNLVEWVSREATVVEYRQATAEAIAFLVWLKRFAEAELP